MSTKVIERQGGSYLCPVCRRFAQHADDCPVNGLMALSWNGLSPDDRAKAVTRG